MKGRFILKGAGKCFPNYVEIFTKDLISLRLMLLVECGQLSPVRPKFLSSCQKCLRIVLGVEGD